MSDRILYEFDKSQMLWETEFEGMVDDGVLVKVEPCVHGNYEPHIPHHRGNMPRYLSNGDLEWCDGKPEADADVKERP